jgi:hypothetical protein
MVLHVLSLDSRRPRLSTYLGLAPPHITTMSVRTSFHAFRLGFITAVPSRYNVELYKTKRFSGLQGQLSVRGGKSANAGHIPDLRRSRLHLGTPPPSNRQGGNLELPLLLPAPSVLRSLLHHLLLASVDMPE